jgi:hypothetical protein
MPGSVVSDPKRDNTLGGCSRVLAAGPKELSRTGRFTPHADSNHKTSLVQPDRCGQVGIATGCVDLQSAIGDCHGTLIDGLPIRPEAVEIPAMNGWSDDQFSGKRIWHVGLDDFALNTR